MRTAQAVFWHRLSGVLELPQACSPLTGGKFFAEPQRGCAYPAGAQEGRHLRFPPSDFLPFPLDSLAQIAYM